jgi:hypothetical protein
MRQMVSSTSASKPEVLDLIIASPQLRIPQQEESGSGVLLYLGDMQLKPWFDLDE